MSEELVTQETNSSWIEEQIKQRREGRRLRVDHGGTLCSRCYINPPQATHKYCKPCKSADAKSRRARNKAALESVAAIAKGGA